MLRHHRWWRQGRAAVTVCIPYVLVAVKIEPNHQGFYCDDDSIRYPYRGDTVTVGMLLGTCLLLPLVSFIAVEFPHHWSDGGRRGWAKAACKSVAKLMGLYLYGLVITMGLTEAGKLTVGRLRPHFVDVCQPDFSRLNCSQGYIEAPLCTNTDSSNQRRLREARKSFPSGHASFAFYIAAFLGFYYQQRIRLHFSVLLSLTLQAVLVLGAVFCSLSRVMDHKHHLDDVLVGALLGFMVAIWVIFALSKLLGYRQYHIGSYKKRDSEGGEPNFNRLNLQYTDDLEDFSRRDPGVDEGI